MRNYSSQTRGVELPQGHLRRWSIAAAMVITACLVAGTAPAAAQDVAAPAKAKSVKVKAAAKAAEAEPEQTSPAAAPKKRDPAEAQRTLDSGIRLLQAGKAEQAIQSFTVVISGGNLPPPIMAKALHQRGAAYRATAKPALALSDLTSALWLKGGLSEVDRADAVQQRSAAYREAGLPDQTDNEGKPAGTVATRRAGASPASVGSGFAATTTAAVPPVTTASLAPDSAPTQASAQASASATPLGNLFSNLFGGGSSSAAAAVPRQPPAPAAAAAPSPPATSAWSSATSVAAPRVRTASAATAAVAAPQAAASTAVPTKAVTEGAVHARMIVRSEADASKLATRLKGEFAAQLGGRSASVSQTQFGGMGSFFQVRVGPYKSPAEAQDFCKRVKPAGADCVAVTQ